MYLYVRTKVLKDYRDGIKRRILGISVGEMVALWWKGKRALFDRVLGEKVL